LLPTLATAGLMATGGGTWAARALVGVKPMVLPLRALLAR
jgi:hypothetical protein